MRLPLLFSGSRRQGGAFGFRGRLVLVAALLPAVLAAAPSAAQAVEPALKQRFFTANCNEATCGEGKQEIKGSGIMEVGEPNVEEAEKGGFRTAAGYVPFGVNAFQLNAAEIEQEAKEIEAKTPLYAERLESVYKKTGGLVSLPPGAPLVPLGCHQPLRRRAVLRGRLHRR